MMGDYFSHRPARAAAYAVVALAHGARVEHVSTVGEDIIDGRWVPWALVDWSDGLLQEPPLPRWGDLAIMAAEIIAMSPERANEGPHWDAIDLQGLELADRMTAGIFDESEPLYLVGERLCGEWWQSVAGDERRKCIELAQGEFRLLWEQAMESVKGGRALIDDLAKILSHAGHLNQREVHLWWTGQWAG